MKLQLTREHVPLGITLLFCFMLWAIFHVWTRHMVTELGYQISAQQSVKEQLISDNNSLKLEVSTLMSSKRLELIAKNELGLKTPDSDQVVYLWLDE